MASLIRLRSRVEPTRSSGRIHAPHQIRALRSSAAIVDPTNRNDALSLVRYRQPWQERAWELLDEVGEFRYTTRLHGNSAEKVEIFPAVYMPDRVDPVPIEDSDLASYANLAHDALDRLGGVDARRDLARRIVENFETVGECCIVGRTDNGSGVPREVWEIRSTSEVHVTRDSRIIIRDTPNGSTRPWDSGAYEIQPDDVIARMWVPHPRFLMQADSTARSAQSILEELVILSKEVHAEATNRVATRGIFVLPDSWTVLRSDGTAATDAEDDPLLATLIETGTEAIRDPGSASAAFPVLMRAPAESTKDGQHYTFDNAADRSKDRRAEALGRFATMANLPKEVLTGISVGNHWSGWLVDQQRWRDHLEPGTRNMVDALTAAFYRRYLVAGGMPAEVADRCAVWYDPAGAIVKSDRTEAARDAYDRFELSGEAYREYAGFSDDEAPDDEETLRRAALKSVIDPAAALAILLGKDPEEAIAPPPAAEPAPVDTPPDGQPVEGPPNGGELPANDPGEKQQPAVAASARLPIPAVPTPLAIATPRAPLVAAVTSGRAAALSRRLLRIDQTLRAELRQAAEDTVRRALEKTGARLVTKVRRDSVAAAAIRDVPRWQVPARLATLGPAVTAALGLDDQQTLESELAVLALLWRRRVQQGQEQAVDTAAELLGADVAVLFDRAGPTLRADAEAGWRWLADGLARRMQDTLTQDLSKDIEASRLVPAGIIRGALAIAGGYNHGTSAGLADDGRPVDPSDPPGQIGTGRTIAGLLEAGGAQLVTWEWVHGVAADPFQPHVDLDGETFTDWTGPELANSDPFPDFGGYFPGDHAGCSCDVLTVWDSPGSTDVDA